MAKEDYMELIDGDQPEIEITNGKVSLKGEEIPEEVTPPVKESIVAEEPPTQPEAEEEPPHQEEGELTPFEKEFYARGLDKQFKDPMDMMSRVPEMNKYINDLSVERKRLRELEKQAPQPGPEQAPSSDDFYSDPVSIINKMVESKVGEVHKKLQEIEVQNFVNSKSDYADMEPLMESALMRNPDLQTLGIKALPILYQMAKAEQLSKVGAQPAYAPSPKKSSAESSVGKKSPPVDKNDLSYWAGTTAKQREEEFGVIPLYND